ncbi:hypothetical protein DMH18_30745 [Streptomyces sp. WAC 06783]|nr:hypothetical protein DMH18_30745 [Streptomyces sp. WAC 06783]
MQAALEAEQEELAKGSDLTALVADPETLREIWEASPLAERRELIRCALPRVTIAPAERQGDRTPILKRLTPHWIDGPSPTMGKVAKVQMVRGEFTTEELGTAA